VWARKAESVQAKREPHTNKQTGIVRLFARLWMLSTLITVLASAQAEVSSAGPSKRTDMFYCVHYYEKKARPEADMVTGK